MLPTDPSSAAKDQMFASSFTVGTIVVLVVAKMLAYVYSGSGAVLSTLIDSVSDAGLSVMTLMSLRLSHKPADANHRQGHGKIEGVAALLQGAILLGAGVFLGFEAINRIIEPQDMTAHLFTLMLLAFSMALSILRVVVQRRTLKRNPSLALEADHVHYSTDVWINLAAIVVVALDYLNLAPQWLDPVATLLVAALLVNTARSISGKAVDMLMDRELPPDVREKILAIVVATPEVQGVHDLRTHQSGIKKFISFDMEVDPNLLLWSAHEIARAVEHNLLAEYPEAEILIHLDPAGDTADTRHIGQKGSPGQ